jgi:hypothetical protein
MAKSLLEVDRCCEIVNRRSDAIDLTKSRRAHEQIIRECGRARARTGQLFGGDEMRSAAVVGKTLAVIKFDN